MNSRSLEAAEEVVLQRHDAICEEEVRGEAESDVDRNGDEHHDGAEGGGARLARVGLVGERAESNGGGNFEENVATCNFGTSVPLVSGRSMLNDVLSTPTPEFYSPSLSGKLDRAM